MPAALIRHPTPDVPPGLCYGRLDVKLAEAAAGETARLIAALPAWHGVVVWSSPLGRCRGPAQTIAQALRALPPRIDPRLRELDFGDWEGRLWSQIERKTLDAWAAQGTAFTPPGGEPLRSLITRVTAFWNALPRGAHILVTHGGPLKVLSALARGHAVDLLRPTMGYATVEIVTAPGDAAQPNRAGGGRVGAA